MKISTEKPPIYERIREAFGVDWDNGLIITYGDTIHCKKGGMSLDLVEHESIHVRQQANMGRDAWWEKYFSDPAFRLSQELQAYKVQADYIKKNVSNRAKREHKLLWICRSMADMYGGMITYEEAKEHIL